MKPLCLPDGAAFEHWLRENHSSYPGLWLNFAKKNSPLKSLYYPEAVHIALLRLD